MAGENDDVAQSWRAQQALHVPLSVAAALTHHRVYGNARAIQTPEDYETALNAAATALSRLTSIYSLDTRTGTHTPVLDKKDWVNGSIFRGATALELKDGTILSLLTVKRTEMLAAIEALEGAVTLPPKALPQGEPLPADSGDAVRPPG